MLHFAAPAKPLHFSEPSAIVRLSSSIRRAFMAAVEKLGIDESSFPAFESAFLSKMVPLIKKGVESGAEQALAALNAPLAFDLKNPAVQNWIDKHAAELVRQVSADTQSGLRAILSRGYSSGLTPQQMAKQIRAVVGLTERQSLAVDNYRRGLTERGVSETRIQTLTDRYGARQLRYRANFIATNESLTAANRGQREAWNQSAERGFIDASKARRVWILSPTPCPVICQPMQGVSVKFDEEFEVGDPPAHVSCGCTMGLEFT
jgi:hypothetical protein